MVAENLSSEAISHAPPSSMPEGLAAGGVVWSLLPGPQDAPLECTGTGCVHEYDLTSEIEWVHRVLWIFIKNPAALGHFCSQAGGAL